MVLISLALKGDEEAGAREQQASETSLRVRDTEADESPRPSAAEGHTHRVATAPVRGVPAAPLAGVRGRTLTRATFTWQVLRHQPRTEDTERHFAQLS